MSLRMKQTGKLSFQFLRSYSIESKTLRIQGFRVSCKEPECVFGHPLRQGAWICSMPPVGFLPKPTGAAVGGHSLWYVKAKVNTVVSLDGTLPVTTFEYELTSGKCPMASLVPIYLLKVIAPEQEDLGKRKKWVEIDNVLLDKLGSFLVTYKGLYLMALVKKQDIIEYKQLIDVWKV